MHLWPVLLWFEMWTCGAVLSFDSTRQVGRWGCGTAPTASPTPHRCRRFVWKKFPSRSNVVFEVTWLEVLQWCRLHQGLVGDGTLHGMTDHWVEMFFVECFQKQNVEWETWRDGTIGHKSSWREDCRRWQTPQQSPAAPSSCLASRPASLPGLLSWEKSIISWEWSPLKTLGNRPEEIHFCIQACPNYQIPCVTPTRPRQVSPAKKNYPL